MGSVGGQGLTEQDGIVARWFDMQQCAIAIVRPDHYVYGIASTPEIVEPLLASLRKALEAPPGPELTIGNVSADAGARRT